MSVSDNMSDKICRESELIVDVASWLVVTLNKLVAHFLAVETMLVLSGQAAMKRNNKINGFVSRCQILMICSHMVACWKHPEKHCHH